MYKNIIYYLVNVKFTLRVNLKFRYVRIEKHWEQLVFGTILFNFYAATLLRQNSSIVAASGS